MKQSMHCTFFLSLLFPIIASERAGEQANKESNRKGHPSQTDPKVSERKSLRACGRLHCFRRNRSYGIHTSI